MALEQAPVTSILNVLNIYVKAPAILTDNGSQTNIIIQYIIRALRTSRHRDF